MKNIIAFSGSNSSQSINQAVINGLADNNENIKAVLLTDYDIPMYGIDLELSAGIPEGVTQLMQEILDADSIIISTPEHNSMTTAFFKNILDWLSRTGVKYFEGKPVLLMSVSPGNGGAKNAANYVEKVISYAGASNISKFSLPRFSENFDQDKGMVTDTDLSKELNAAVLGL